VNAVRRELLELASDLVRRGEPFALATVVARTPPISAQLGDTALITADGSFYGWVGGSCTRPTVIAQARKALEDNRPRLVALDPDPELRLRPGLEVFPMTCHSGGRVEIHIQPILPPPQLLVYGMSPTARALVRLGGAMGYRVHAIDPAADASDYLGADVVVTDPASVRIAGGSAPVYAVVATQGQWDEEAVAAALALSPSYLGVMASAKRFAQMRAWLAERAPEASLARIRNPAGIDLGATLPEEIAISILAEIVKERAARTRAVVASAAERSEPSSVETRDPVCGMTVRVDGARHHARHEGQEFYFCCEGCRERFVAAPGRYTAAEPVR
jgi:xanthine dehydrogenase accessory factor